MWCEDECTQGKTKEAAHNGLYGNGITQGCGNSDEDGDEQIEVAFCTPEHEQKELFHEEEGRRRLHEQCGEEPTDNSHCLENIIERNEKIVQFEECEVQNEAKNQQAKELVTSTCCLGNITEIIEHDNVWKEDVLEEAEVLQDNIQTFREANLVGEIWKRAEAPGKTYEWQGNKRDQGMLCPVEDVIGKMLRWDENKSQSQTTPTVKAVEHVSCRAADSECKQTEKVLLCEKEQVCQIIWGNPQMEENERDQACPTQSTGEMPRCEENRCQTQTNHTAEQQK